VGARALFGGNKEERRQKELEREEAFRAQAEARGRPRVDASAVSVLCCMRACARCYQATCQPLNVK